MKMHPTEYQDDAQEEQAELREKCGFDGIGTVLALKAYLAICEECGIAPEVFHSGSSAGDHWRVRVCFDEDTPIMEAYFTEDLLKLINHYGYGVLDVLLDVYRRTKVLSSMIIPKFIEAMAGGVELSELGVLADAVLRQKKNFRRDV